MSRIAEHYPYIIHHITECFHTPAYVFDHTGTPVCPDSSEIPENPAFLKRIVQSSFVKEQKNSRMVFPQILDVEDNLYFAIFPCEKDCLLLLGPVGSNYLTVRQTDDFRKKYQLTPEKKRIPKMPIQQLMSMISLIWFMLTGTPLENHQITIRQNISFALSAADAAAYSLYTYKEDKKRSSYEGEQLWCSYIENGDVRKMNEMISHAQNIFSSFENVGTLAKDDDYKQLEYTLVTSISLAMHAAIRGGVAPLKCYETSDLLLQKAAVCSDILKLYSLFIETFRTFTMLVYTHNQEPEHSLLIEQCKDYIARHLYHPFRIAEMSAELNINNNYLSQLFSKETGMTIQHYIRRKRLHAAANLLKYSEESVGQISDYMQFSSPSRFSSYFKETYHMTPLEYRSKYKIAEFKDLSV